MTSTPNGILTIALRDVTKLFRDRTRMIASLVFPVIFIGVLGGGLNASFGEGLGYSFLAFVFTGVLAQTMFQSTASGVISLIEDRENDFSRELFVAPISRYAIVVGKILGESLVAFVQGIGIFAFGFILGVPLSIGTIAALIPVMLVACLLGGAFGIIVLANLNSQRKANQIFPFVIFPQFFLAGVFNPVNNLPLVLSILSKIAPMTYAVNLIRTVYYAGSPELSRVILFSAPTTLLVIGAMFAVFLLIGTYFFIRNERER